MSDGYENRHGRMVASDACCYGRVLLLPAWICMSIRLPMFFSYYYCYYYYYLTVGLLFAILTLNISIMW